MSDKTIKLNHPTEPITVRARDMGDGTFAIVQVNEDGTAGVTNTTNTTAVSGNFSAITLLADTVFSSLTETGATGQAMTGITLPAGLTIFGKFTAYTLASGAVRAYNA